MEIKLSLNKDVNSNANFYFEKAKKLKKKLPGVDTTIEKTLKEIDEFEDKKESYLKKKEMKEKLEVHKKKEWFDKFRSTVTSGGFLFVIGKDASTNEVLIKKHMEENDLIFHTEASGSPWGLLKDAKDKASKEDIEEAAQFLTCFSAQWKKGFGTADAFWVTHDQVTKKTMTKEYAAKGAFMVYGKKNILKNIQLKVCLGVQTKELKTDEGEVIEFLEMFSGVENACKKYCKNRFVKIEPGQSTYKALTKEIKKRLKLNSIDDLPSLIPNNGKVLKR